jgi:hypothetical protein
MNVLVTVPSSPYFPVPESPSKRESANFGTFRKHTIHGLRRIIVTFAGVQVAAKQAEAKFV